MSQNDQSCCRQEPRCKNAHTCDYYYKGKTPVRLGGIYDPPTPVPKPESQPPSPEEEEEEDDGETRKQKCQINAQAWAQNFKEPAAPSKEEILCCRSEVEMVLKQAKEKRLPATGSKLMKQPFGHTMGYTTGTEPADIYENAYKGLMPTVKGLPDYPTDLHMRKVCKQRLRKGRQLKTWEDDSGNSLLKDTVVPKFSPSPDSTPSGSYTKLTTNSRAGTGSVTRLGGDMTGKMQSSMPVSADEMILKYIEKYNLISLMEYFLALTCISAPENPFKFISDIARKMVLARTDPAEFDNLMSEGIFQKDHMSALFRLFDKEQSGFITLSQYKTGMETLGLLEYNLTPEGQEIDRIDEEVFVLETIRALEQLLRSFLVQGKSPPLQKGSKLSGKFSK